MLDDIPEIWRSVRNYPGIHVSSYGNVRDSRTNEFIRKVIDRQTKEPKVTFSWGSWTYSGPVWHLMLGCFYNLGDYAEVFPEYRDDDPTNLDIFNLRWNKADGTPIIFRYDDITGDWKRVRKHARGVQIVETGEVFESVRACAEYINGDSNAIYIVLRSDNRMKRHKGFTFRYTD